MDEFHHMGEHQLECITEMLQFTSKMLFALQVYLQLPYRVHVLKTNTIRHYVHNTMNYYHGD